MPIVEPEVTLGEGDYRYVAVNDAVSILGRLWQFQVMYIAEDGISMSEWS